MSTTNILSNKEINPLQSIEQWEDDVLTRYPVAGEKTKAKEEFRNYESSEKDATVREFYRLNHKYQTYEFVRGKQKEFLQFNRKEMKPWEAMEFLNTFSFISDGIKWYCFTILSEFLISKMKDRLSSVKASSITTL